MNNSVNMPCPECSHELEINAMDLLGGKEITCPSCGSKISLDSNRDAMKDIRERFDKLRKKNDR